MPDPIIIAADFVSQLELDVRLRFAATRLTLTRYAVLARADGASASDLARAVGVTKQMVSKTVRELWLLGYLMKVPSVDRRRHLLKVTDHGREALDQARQLNLPAGLVAAMQSYIAGAVT